MAFNTIPSGWLDIGDPTKKEIFDYIKDNFDNHETRIQSVESFGANVEVLNFDFRNASDFATLTSALVRRINRTMTLNFCMIQIYLKGALTGTLEIDILKATSLGGVYSSVFTTRPSIAFASAVDYGASTNQVFSVSQVNLVAGNYLKLSITSMPANGTLSKFKIILTSEAT